MRAIWTLLRFVSRPELLARPVRSMLLVGTVTVGVALLTAMHVATHSIVAGFGDDLQRLGGRAQLQVTFGTGEVGFPEDMVAKVAALPFVEQAAALVRSQVTFETGERETVELFGIDLLQADVLDLYQVEVLEREKDDFAILNDPRGVFVTDVLARERGLSLGSTVLLSAVDGVHDFTVRGVLATKGLAQFLSGRLVAMYLPAAQPVAGKRADLRTSMVDQVDVRLRPGTEMSVAQRDLDAMLGPGFHASEPMQRRMVGERTVEGLRATLVGMSSLALLAAIFIVYASTTTMVVERLAAMATLASVGAAPRILVRTVVAEAAVLGLIGSAVGVAVGLVLSSLIGEDAAAGMGLNYSLPFDASRVSWDPWVVFVAHPLGGVTVAAFSAFLPARRLRSVTPLVLQRDQDSFRTESVWSMREALFASFFCSVVGAAVLGEGVVRADSMMVSSGGLFVVAGAVAATFPLLRTIWLASARLLNRLFGIAGSIAGENLQRSMDRTLVTASAITLSVAIAVGAGSLVHSFRSSVATWYGFAGDALVTSRSVTGGWLAAPVGRELEAQLSALSQVADVQTLRVMQGQPYADARIALAGLSSGLLRGAMENGHVLGSGSREDAVARVLSGEAVAVSENFRVHFGVAAENPTVELASLHGNVRLPVVAVVPDYVSDKGSVVLSRNVVEDQWADTLVNYYVVTLKDGISVDALARAVEGAFPDDQRLAVVPTSHMVERVDQLIGQAFSDIDTIKLLVLFLTAVGIADLVVSNVLSRSRELAVFRLVGLTDAQLVLTARIEGVCITLGATFCGILVGTLCAWLWVHYNYPALVGYVLQLRVAWGSMAVSVGLAVASAWGGATLASRYALRQSALAALRYD